MVTEELTVSVELDYVYPSSGRESIGRAGAVGAAVSRLANECATFDPLRFTDFTARKGKMMKDNFSSKAKHPKLDNSKNYLYGYVSVEVSFVTTAPARIRGEVHESDDMEVLT